MAEPSPSVLSPMALISSSLNSPSWYRLSLSSAGGTGGTGEAGGQCTGDGVSLPHLLFEMNQGAGASASLATHRQKHAAIHSRQGRQDRQGRQGRQDRQGRQGRRQGRAAGTKPRTCDAGVDAIVLAQHDLPGARVLPEQGAAVVDDKGGHSHRLQMQEGEARAGDRTRFAWQEVGMEAVERSSSTASLAGV